jgi:serine protease Do
MPLGPQLPTLRFAWFHRQFIVAWWLVILVALITVDPVRAFNPRRTPIVDVVERVRSAVVNIHSERTVRSPVGPDIFMAPTENRVNGMGTGVIIDPRGYIITNQHVVEDVNAIRVRLNDGTNWTASVLARDSESDLALIKIDPGRPLPTMPLGTAQDILVGETVIAIGNAYGYEHSVTVGVVSAVKRDVTLNKEVSYKSLIQTDASINPGNSGGPLLNVHGEMIGVNVAIRAGAQGISFAIPVDTMIQVAAEMVNGQRRHGVWHGLVCRDRLVTAPAMTKVSASSADPEAIPVSSLEPNPLKRELLVEKIEPDSPAAKAGLQSGDILAKAGDLDIGCSLDLERALLGRAAGERLAVTVRRKGESRDVQLALVSQERTNPSPSEVVWRKLGLRLKPVEAALVSRTSQQLHGGLVVADVNTAGVAAKAGIQRGDILIGLHQWETLTLENAVFVLTHPDLPGFNPLCFYIIRSGQIRRGWFQQVD